MPSSWDVYYVVFLSALLALGVPAFLAVISFLLSSRPRAGGRDAAARPEAPSSSRTLLGSRINARFFLGVNASLLLIALALALIPCAGALGPDKTDPVYLRSLIAIISLAAFAGLGLLYASRKGDLSWVSSIQLPRPVAPVPPSGAGSPGQGAKEEP